MTRILVILLFFVPLSVFAQKRCAKQLQPQVAFMADFYRFHLFGEENKPKVLPKLSKIISRHPVIAHRILFSILENPSEKSYHESALELISHLKQKKNSEKRLLELFQRTYQELLSLEEDTTDEQKESYFYLLLNALIETRSPQVFRILLNYHIDMNFVHYSKQNAHNLDRVLMMILFVTNPLVSEKAFVYVIDEVKKKGDGGRSYAKKLLSLFEEGMKGSKKIDGSALYRIYRKHIQAWGEPSSIKELNNK